MRRHSLVSSKSNVLYSSPVSCNATSDLKHQTLFAIRTNNIKFFRCNYTSQSIPLVYSSNRRKSFLCPERYPSLQNKNLFLPHTTNFQHSKIIQLHTNLVPHVYSALKNHSCNRYNSFSTLSPISSTPKKPVPNIQHLGPIYDNITNESNKDNSNLKSSINNKDVDLHESDAIAAIKHITKNDALLEAVVKQGMSGKGRKKWIHHLISYIDSESTIKNSQSSSLFNDDTGVSHGTQLDIEHTPNKELSQQLSNSEKDRADKIFHLIDGNQDGLIGMREFRIWFSTYYLQHNKLPIIAPKSLNDTALTNEENEALSKCSETDSKIKTQFLNNQTSQNIKGMTSDDKNLLNSNQRSIDLNHSFNNIPNPNKPSNDSLGINHSINKNEKFNNNIQMTPSPSTNKHPEDEEEDEDADVQTRLICHVILRSSIPYLAFGIIDNGLMLSCGEWIDSTIGVQFCLSTMASAGFGNALSCATGVVTGGSIERLCLKSKIVQRYSPSMTPKQAVSRKVRNAHLAGSVLGILIGCLIGMFPLFFAHPLKPLQNEISPTTLIV